LLSTTFGRLVLTPLDLRCYSPRLDLFGWIRDHAGDVVDADGKWIILTGSQTFITYQWQRHYS